MRSPAVVLLAAVLGCAQVAHAAPAATIGTKIENFTLKDYRGQSVSLDQAAPGQVVVLAFLGTECPLAKLYAPRLAQLAERLSNDHQVILLGSLATPKYIPILQEALGARLRFPREFIGLGDMSRGSLMLRRAAQGQELDYVADQG